MTTSSINRAAPFLAALLMCATASGYAQDVSRYPEKPPRIVVPFPPGGAADTFARLTGRKLSELWGGKQQVVIDNRSGAGGIIGSDVAAKANPDGYNFLMVTVGHAVNLYTYSKLPYDTRKDLAPVGLVATVPSLVVVGPAFSGKSLKDLISMARATPGALQYATSGTGSTSHVGAALLESMAGISMTHVPYKGAAAGLQDVMGGRVTMSVDIITSSAPLVLSGKLRALAITGAKRSAKLPDVPTVAEAAIPGFDSVSWYLLLAPAKTPAVFLDKVNADLRAIAALPDFRASIENAGGEASSLTRKETADYLNAEFTRWAKVVRERNIKVD